MTISTTLILDWLKQPEFIGWNVLEGWVTWELGKSKVRQNIPLNGTLPLRLFAESSDAKKLTRTITLF